MDRFQDSDLAHFLGDWSQNEKLSEIKPPLQESRSDFKKKFFGPVVHSVHTLFSQVLQVEKGILKEALITSLFFLLYSWSHAERSTCSSTWKYKPSKKIERGAC